MVNLRDNLFFKLDLTQTFDLDYTIWLIWENRYTNRKLMCTCIYHAITQNNCFVKGSHKYDIYLVVENKAHLSWPNKDRIATFGLTQREVVR